MIGALNGAIALTFSGGQRCSSMDTCIGEDGRLAIAVAEYHKIMGEDAGLLRRGTEVLNANDGVPEIDEHRPDLSAKPEHGKPRRCTIVKMRA